MSGALLHDDRLFPAEERTRGLARALYDTVRGLPIVSPHGHTDAGWWAHDRPFADPTSLLVRPDHYLFRMLYSQGISLESLGVGVDPSEWTEARARAAWHVFCSHYHLFRGTPSRLWLDHVLGDLFGVEERLSAATADASYDRIAALLATPAFRPRALFERFNIDVIATTESPLDDLADHRAIRDSGWGGRVITTFRPDPVVDPDYEGFTANIRLLGEIAGEDAEGWTGYLAALAERRRFFIAHGATASDHGHPTAATADLPRADCEWLLAGALAGTLDAREAEAFRGQMLTEMARMSLDDGLVMQIHPGSLRNHNRALFDRLGRDKGADIPTRADYVQALKPLLDRFGEAPGLTVILFTLDESTYARELAPLAGHYPCLRLGPAWWFHDSPEGMRRFREMTTETAGFYNTVGFNDDTRAFPSIPARHDVARRVDCAFLARLVAEHRLDEDEAVDLAGELAHGLARRAYRL